MYRKREIKQVAVRVASLLCYGLLATASASNLIVPAAHAAGEPDLSFGKHGKLIVRPAGLGPNEDEYASAALVDANGRYVIGGTAGLPGTLFTGLIVWVLPDGSLDPSVNSGKGFSLLEWKDHGVAIKHMREVAAGAILVAGFPTSLSEEQAPDNTPIVCRVRSDGVMDTMFGDDGCIPVGTIAGRHVIRDASVTGLAALPDGGIVVLGDASSLGNGRSLALVKLTQSGAIDHLFGDADCPGANPRCGSIFSPQWLGETVDSAGLAVDTTGQHLAVAISVVDTGAIGITRFDADGEMTGISLADFDAVAGGASTADPRGIVVSDDASVSLLGSIFTQESRYIGMARFLANGAPDSAFGVDGVGVYTVDATFYQKAHGLALQDDGRIAIAAATDTHCKLMRLQPHGTLDAAFAEQGVAEIPLDEPGNHDCDAAVALIDRQYLLIVGTENFSPDEGGKKIFLHRFEGQRVFADGFEAP